MPRKNEDDEQELTDARVALAEQLSKLLGEQGNKAGASKRSAKSPAPKVIRDSFTLPESDYQLIPTLQERALGLRIHVTKSELLRAGLHALESLSEERFIQVLQGVEKLKPGRRKDS